MPVIICEIKPFDITQKIYVQYQNTSGKSFNVNMSEVPILIADLAHTENINKVHLFGVAVYCDEIADEIYSECITRFSNNNIEIEVN